MLKGSLISSGIGTAPHLSGELFNQLAGVKLVHVPYKQGSAQAVTDLVAGQIQVLFNNAISTVPFVQANRVRALATTGAKRLFGHIRGEVYIPGLLNLKV